MAAALPALVISLDYRLAPEHRLPAAYEDAVEAVLWVRAQAQDPAAGEPWLTNGDFSRCFLMGSSSGANMAYHAGLRTVALELQPVRLVGLILNQPYFGGVERTPSELASEEDVVLPLCANDMMWRLALPKGADRDHEFSNPVVAPPRPIRLPRCMVKGCQGDPLIDRQRAFVKMLEEEDDEGASVVAGFDEGGFHAIELFDPGRGQALFAEIRDFISSSVVDATAAS
ncbi:putative carboxylesterase 8 [Cocos nucifera]|nr:putative carboxylesterase 8 [Cocos nucifera]